MEGMLFHSHSLALVSPNGEQYDLLLRQLRERMDEGCGETIYVLGVGSDGGDYGLNESDMQASVATVRSMCEQIEADLILLRERTEAGGQVRDYLIRRRVGEADFLEVRVAVVGNVDAGKSTLLGVLTHGELDNGRGFARQKLFRHKHEMESGRTSSVGNDILGFDQEGQVVNKPDSHGGSLDWTKICEKSSKVITFIDLAGHEKYLKTTVFGMTGHLPDFCMLMIGSNAGIVGMTKEHLGLALALNVPVFVVVTKIDMCPANILQETLKLLQKILKSPGCRKIPVLVQNKDDVIVTASNFSSERICPIFQISNVTGENMDLLKMFLNLLSSRSSFKDHEPAEFQIDDTYSVPGVGTVVSGTTLRGLIRLNDTLLLGPDPLGAFLPITVKSIHRKRMPVKEVRGGQTASFALKKVCGVVMRSSHCTILARFFTRRQILRNCRQMPEIGGKSVLVHLLLSTNNQPSNSKPPQIKMQSTKKAPARREDGVAPSSEESASTGSPAAQQSVPQQPKSGGRRRGGQRHKGKPQSNSTVTLAGAVGGC
uniref:GTP-binding protein 1 n=1 Tax=Sinocyclocheilus anshuiensis TaxID=1608454 RepID=A0A671P3U4_9TELE